MSKFFKFLTVAVYVYVFICVYGWVRKLIDSSRAVKEKEKIISELIATEDESTRHAWKKAEDWIKEQGE